MEYLLDANQMRTLRAAMDRIIPADDFPGAFEAGVADYIGALLGDELHGSAESFARGLAMLDREAQARFGRGLADLSAAQQDVVLKAIEASEFFNLLVRLTVEGYYSDPGNRGNRGEIAWKMIGYEPRGQTRSHP